MAETYSNSNNAINNKDNNKEKKLNISLKVHNNNNQNFNYQDEKVLSYNTTVKKETEFYTIDKDNKIVIYNEQKSIIKYDCKILFRIRKNKDGDFEIISPTEKISYSDINLINQLDQKMWLVMKSDDKKGKFKKENEEYYLLKNDIIRLADKKYAIIEINIKNKSNSLENKNKINETNQLFGPVLEKEIDEEDICVKDGEKCIKCEKSNSSEDNPILKLCNCPKHYTCLKEEIKKNIKINKNLKKTVTSYKCEKYNCSDCSKPYPFQFIYKGNEFELIDIEKPSKDEDYIILESLTFIKEENNIRNNIKNIFVVKLMKEKLTIGRNVSNIEKDINDEEVTISRNHAILKFNKENGNLTIINDQGRYGVLVLIKDNVKLTDNEKIYFQVGKVYVEAEVKG